MYMFDWLLSKHEIYSSPWLSTGFGNIVHSFSSLSKTLEIGDTTIDIDDSFVQRSFVVCLTFNTTNPFLVNLKTTLFWSLMLNSALLLSINHSYKDPDS